MNLLVNIVLSPVALGSALVRVVLQHYYVDAHFDTHMTAREVAATLRDLAVAIENAEDERADREARDAVGEDDGVVRH